MSAWTSTNVVLLDESDKLKQQNRIDSANVWILQSLGCKCGFQEKLLASNIYKIHYYMAQSHKDWELPNSWIWLAEIDIDRKKSRPASRPVSFCVEKVANKNTKMFIIFFCFLLNHLLQCQKAWWQKKNKEDEKILAGLS